MPKLESCTECHRPDTSAARGAGVACQTCHVYHDRTAEWSNDGPFTVKELTAPPPLPRDRRKTEIRPQRPATPPPTALAGGGTGQTQPATSPAASVSDAPPR